MTRPRTLRTAILVLSRDGLALARRLRDARGGGPSIFGPSCVVGPCGGTGPADGRVSPALPRGAFATSEPGVFGWNGPLRAFWPGVREGFEAVVGVMALGIVVRIAGPLAGDKRTEPALVAVDEVGRFAIAVLGGHAGGANALAREVATALGATPVITTASDSRGLPAVDLIGRDRGWRIEQAENLTRAAAAVVRGEVVAVFQDAGSPDWWRDFGPWPASFVRLERVEDWRRQAPIGAALVISDRIEPPGLPPDRTLVYRPRTLVAGVGCKRGTPREAIEAWVDEVFARAGLAIGSLAAVATVSLKADEPGLIAFAESRGVPLRAFPPEELVGVPGVERPSRRVLDRIGIPAVAEPAALVAAGTRTLLVPKQVGPGVTAAIARLDDGH